MTATDAPTRRPGGAWEVLRRGLRLSPEFRAGLPLTLALAVVATAGRVVVPIAIQLTIDRGVLAPDGADLRQVAVLTVAALAAVALTAAAGYLMIARLVRLTESALSNLRVRAFRHIHDLSALHHAAEHRGSLVARVTADVDEISRFMQWGGIVLVVNVGQLAFATAVMAVYSWQLTLVVLLTFFPLAFVLRWFQGRLGHAYDLVRTRVGEMLTTIGESVVGAPVVRAYGIEERTNARIVDAVDRQFDAVYRAHRTASVMFSSGEVFAALATAAAVVVGVLLGPGGGLSAGRLVSFLFLIGLFVAPVQVATEVLDQAQTAIAGWRRILGVLDTPADVADPGARPGGGRDIPPGPIAVSFRHVCFHYPPRPSDAGKGSASPEVLHDITVDLPAQSRIAIVGETGSGKTTFAKLLTRLMDPTSGEITINGVPVREAPFAQLRRRVVMVPQEGFLFDGTVADNVRMGRPGLSDDDVRLAFLELGLADWVSGLPAGVSTRVGERGQALSAGERQLVALARAYVANPELLVLDEATSAVDPATEGRLQRALEGLTRGRTAVAIAHRLSTARAADEVLVFDRGRIVQRGPHDELVSQAGVYAALHESWAAPAAHG
ncbi:MAG TPA: ABC transporter ATP-binding protein [Egibacteraceae bacterium]|nr:ABC transporter ATP-binding protein [Egibacteraceae bacterium]